LDVYEPKLKFRKYKIDVSAKKGGSLRALSKPFPGGEKKLESYPLVIQAIAPEVYFRDRGSMNPIAAILRNPIFLIMGVFALLKYFAGNVAEEPKDGDAAAQGGQPQPGVAGDDDDAAPSLLETKTSGRSRRGKHD